MAEALIFGVWFFTTICGYESMHALSGVLLGTVCQAYGLWELDLRGHANKCESTRKPEWLGRPTRLRSTADL